MTRYLCVHSPFLGPSSIAVLAAELGAAVAHPSPAAPAAGAVEPVLQVTVGHSGAGPVLPAVAPRAAAYVFLDAGLPDHGGASMLDSLPGPLADHLRALEAGTGRLPPWTSWWGDEKRALFAGLEADCPSVAWSALEAPRPVPAGWDLRPCAYVRLSPAYDEEASTAAERGWPVVRLDAGHVSPFTDPAAVAGAVRQAVAELGLEPW